LFVACRAVVSQSKEAQWPSHRAPSAGIKLIMCALILKSSQCPHGKIADMLAPTHACTTANAPVNYRMYVQQRPSKVPIAPMEFSHVLHSCLQGSGVFVQRAYSTVTISSSTISGNTAAYVRPHPQKFPMPRDGKVADVLATTYACTTAAETPVNYSMYVLQRP
jgi:hypothetical protein